MNKTGLLITIGAIAGSVLLAQWAPAASQAPVAQAEVKKLMNKELPDFPGKEGTMITVTYPPGYMGEIHRHEAHAFVYVLEGSIVMQVKGGAKQTVNAGETFYEAPNDIHLVGGNASDSKPAKFLVVLVKNKGAPIVLPVQ